VLANVKSFC